MSANNLIDPRRTRCSKVNLSEQKMIVEQFLNGELPKKEFCQLHNLNKSTFKNWVFRHKPDLQTQNPQPVFLPVNIEVDHHSYGDKDNLENDGVKLFSQAKHNTNAQPDLVSSTKVIQDLPIPPKEMHHNCYDRLTITCNQLTVQIPVGFDESYLRTVLKIVADL